MATNEIIEINDMQILHYIRKCLESMGFMPNQRPLNGRVLAGLFLFLSNVFTSIMFLLFGANTFWEYTNAIFLCLVNGVSFSVFIILICQVGRFFKTINFGQKLFENSKHRFHNCLKRKHSQFHYYVLFK